jgi:exopolysaccharide biosynthesis polyprenyl glycosylphosphotransferase
VYQFESITRRGRLGGQRLAERADSAPPDLPEPPRPVGGALIGERLLLVVVDAAAVGGAALATGARWPAILAVPALAAAGLHRPRLRFSALDDAPRILLGVGAVGLAGGWVPPPVLPPVLPAVLPRPTLLWPVLMLLGVLVGRGLAYRAVRHRRRQRPGEPTVVIGSGDVAIRLAEALHEDPAYGLAPVGVVGPPPLTGPALPVPLLGPTGAFDPIVARYQPRHLIVAFSGPPDVDLVAALRRCRHEGVTVHVVPRLFELALGRCGAELVGGVPLIRLRPEPAHLRRWVVKRVIDIVGAVFGLLVLAPVLAACALAARWESGRAGVLFRQERIGRDGRPFTILKFRSLTPACEHESRVRWNISADARVGPVGRLLRASSLDELPQLFNVLRGDMSLVGPRPERPFFVEQFQRTYAGYADRHRVPAGITGWAQIHGLRGDTSIDERVRFDNYYIENWSIGLDMKIIVRTVGSMLSIHRV